MKKLSMYAALVSLVVVITVSQLYADAQVFEWFGDYNMNHDGIPGTLNIRDLKADCGGPPWCSMSVSYINADGIRYQADVESISDKWQHMVFYIHFPNNRQKFDAYLFSWDKNKLAGTTYWGGRTFGVYAIKK